MADYPRWPVKTNEKHRVVLFPQIRSDALRNSLRMTDAASFFTHLPPAAARLGRVIARPRAVGVCCVVALTSLGWVYLALQASGPDIWAVLCRPLSAAPGQTTIDLALVAAMWAAMTLAMMLPSAGPMILTYAEIAETAARKGERVVSPFILTAGYLAVWFGFALLAALAHVALSSAEPFAATAAPAGLLFSAAIFAGAGLYQFSAFKHACLHKCQQPFQFFFTRWATTPGGVFRLGLRQGMYCLGCCWAMMLVMLGAGAMNVVWMAALGIVMTAEKLSRGRKVAAAIGIALFAIAAGFVLTAFEIAGS